MKRLFSLLALVALVAAPAFGQFGATVAVSGDQVIAGGATNDLSPGMLYAYTQADDGTWTQFQALSASEAADGDRFGRSVSITGDWMAVGAPGANSVHFFQKGADGMWTQAGSLTEEVDGFGGQVTMVGNHLVVAVSGGFRSAGSAWAYRWSDDNGWTALGELVPAYEGEEPLRGFPTAIALTEGQLAISASFANGQQGMVWTWKFDGESWGDPGTLEVPFSREGSGVGGALMMTDSYLTVGMPGHDGGMGSAAFFALDPEGNWQFGGRFAPFISGPRGQFGSTIAYGADHVLIGAPREPGGGTIYAFKVENEDIVGSTTIGPMGLDENARFGSTIAVNDQVAVVGALGQENRSGVAVPYAIADGQWDQGNYFYHDPPGYASVYGGTVECEEDQAGAFPCKDVNMLSFMNMEDLGAQRGIRTNDIWGWEDPETGREYALVGLTNQTSFVDVTDAENPVLIGTLMLTDTARPSVWRDMKVYMDHAYIVADGANQHGMQVFDLRQLRDFEGTPIEYEMTAYYDGIASSHNIVINEETGFAYAVGNSSGGETCGGGLHMIDISEPANPQFAGCFADGNSGRRGTGYSHDAQCVVYRGPDADYAGREICLGSNETALSISDVTDKSNPTSISIASYPNVAYAHQGWLTEDHRYFYMNDEGDEPRGLVDGTRTLIWDLADLDEPVLVGEHIATTTETDHNLYIRGNIMYQSNYGAGFRVLDISNPTAPVEIAYFDTSPVGGAGGSWSNYPYFKSGTIIVTGGSNGLFVLKQKEIDT